MIRLILAVVAGLLVLPDFARGEDRVVNVTNDNPVVGSCDPTPGDCTLREAVAAAQTGDRVVLGAFTYELNDQLVFDDTFDIDGVSARATTIHSDGTGRIGYIQAGSATFTDLAVSGGFVDNTAPQFPNEGGAFVVDPAAELRMIGVTLTDNQAVTRGGAIANYGDLSVVESTASGNRAGRAPASSGFGGGIYIGANAGAVGLLNSTISGNTAIVAEGFSFGGGIFALDHFTSDFVTIAGNSAVAGAGLYLGNTTSAPDVTNTLIANHANANCGGAVGALETLDEHHNLADDTSCEFDAPGDHQVADAKLAPLADNTGQTDTHGLVNGSPAIDAADPTACPSTDQRGVVRPATGPCAIGAFEGSVGADYTVNLPHDDGDGVCSDGDCTLRDAVEEAVAGDRVILPPGNYELVQGSLPLHDDVVLGSNARSTTIDGGSDDARVFEATVGANRVSGVTITGGEASTGGGVLVQGAGVSLTLTSVTVSGNFANQGGGVANVNAKLDIVRSTITDNDAAEPTNEGEGGGIYSDGANAVTTVTNSTISANRAGSGETGSLGGGIAVFDGSFTARNVTFAGNTAGFSGQQTGGEGGSIYVDPPPVTPTVTISNSIIDSFEPGGCSGAFTRDHNVADDSSCGSPVSSPLLGPLANNGGETNTHAIGATSPAVDKGTGCESTDQRGLARKRACDIGAYEFQGNLPPSGGQQQPPPPPSGGKQLPPPVPGKNVNALPESGTVKIKLPGSNTFVVLTEGLQIPVGTIVDARKGHVTLIAAGGGEAEFYGGIFKIGQGKGAKPLTTLTLTEKLTCPKSKASAAAKKKRKRRLWGDGTGRFRTKGKHSAATVVGTKWLVEDRCTSTLTRVVRGRVRVRDFVKKKNVLVKAGKKYVARARG